MPAVLDTHAWIWSVTKDSPFVSPLVDSCRLPQPFHDYPEIIVATARSHSATLVTRDARLRGYRHVRSVW